MIFDTVKIEKGGTGEKEKGKEGAQMENGEMGKKSLFFKVN